MRKKSVHFVGIKGVAMTAMAIIAKEQGQNVTGSDVKDEFVTDAVLKRNGIFPEIGFKIEHLSSNPDLVVVTGAHGGMTNVEATESLKRGIPTLMQGQALGKLMEGKMGISVCGCHGKTTTSALIATILSLSNLKPSFAVGCGDIPVLKNPGRWDKQGKLFVAESDEYATCPKTDHTPKFLWQYPDILVMTNIEYDHPDIYASLEDVENAYLKFTHNLRPNGLFIACVDNKSIRKIISTFDKRIQKYGLNPQADFIPTNISFEEGCTYFTLSKNKLDLGRFKLIVPGMHNVLNATAAIAASLEAGVDVEKIRNSLYKFSGTTRRFEFVGEKNGVKVYDDYAHHPTEINATLQAARLWFKNNKIIAVFQPHTYSRTRALFDQFTKCFSQADEVIIIDIYSSAREAQDPDVSSLNLASEIKKFHKNVHYFSNGIHVVEYLSSKLKPGDVVFTLGAGNIYQYSTKILESCENNG